MTRPTSLLIFLSALCSLGVAGTAGAEEGIGWPHWAGPHRNSSAPGNGIFQAPFELRELWRRPVGSGISALTVVGGRVFSLENDDQQATAFALDAATGEPLWRVVLGPLPSAQHEFGVASTPASDGRWVVFVGPDCILRGLDAVTGKEAWRHDLRAEYATGALPSGCFTSPLIDGGRVIAQVNGEPDKRVMAFDLASGSVLWSAAGNQRALRSSPTLATLGGVRQILVHDIDKRTSGLYGLRSEDGQLLWSLRFPLPDPKAVVGSLSHDMPILLAGDRVAVPTWDQLVAVSLRREAGAFSAELAWITNEVRAGGNPVNIHAVAHAEHVYGFGGEHLRCLEAATGKMVWSEKIYPGSLIIVDEHLVVLSQSAGLVRIVEMTPAGYREKARRQVFTPGAPTDTPPSFADSRLYLRNADEIVVLGVVPAGAAQP